MQPEQVKEDEARPCRIDGCGKLRSGASTLCASHQYRQRMNGDPEGPLLGSTHSSESYWPTDDRRPWETVSDWCRRLDGYYNAALVVDGDVETYATDEAMLADWQKRGRPQARMLKVPR